MVDRKSDQGKSPRDDQQQAEPHPSFPDLSGASIENIRAILADWRSRAHILPDGATLQVVPDMHRIVADVLWVDPNDQGSVFPTGKVDKEEDQPIWALTYRTLQRFERSANLQWDSRLCRRLDDGGDHRRIEQQAGARIRGLDGAFRTVVEPYTLDIDACEAESYEAQVGKWYWQRGEGQRENVRRKIARNAEYAVKDGKRPWSKEYCDKMMADIQVWPESDREPWAREQARIAMLSIVKHATTRAMSGAKARVIIGALALRRGGYYWRELCERPFVILKLVADIPYSSNPAALAMLVAAETGLADMAFGAGVPVFGEGGLLGRGPAALPALPAPRVVIEQDPEADPEEALHQAAHDDQEPEPQQPPPTREERPAARRPDPAPAEHRQGVPTNELPLQPRPAAPAAASAQTPSTPATGPKPTGRRGPPLWSEQSFDIADREQRIEFLESLARAYPDLPQIDFGRTSDDGLVRYYLKIVLPSLRADQGRA